MVHQDKTRLLQRNAMRGRLIVTQRHHTEIIWSSVDSLDCEDVRSGERIGTPREEIVCARIVLRHAAAGRATADRGSRAEQLDRRPNDDIGQRSTFGGIDDGRGDAHQAGAIRL
jgi:hypothetical protein